MLFVPYAPATADRNQTPQQRRRANHLALLLFAVTASVGLLLKYLPA